MINWNREGDYCQFITLAIDKLEQSQFTRRLSTVSLILILLALSSLTLIDVTEATGPVVARLVRL